MEIISFFESDRREHWLDEIGKCSWSGGAFLHELLKNDTFFDTVGEDSRLLLLTDGEKLVSFCTYAEKDEIQPTSLTPWIGFVYTFPEYRGHRYMGILLRKIELLAKEQNVPKLFISTDHTGLYEKYGFEYLSQMKSIYGDMSRVYVKLLKY